MQRDKRGGGQAAFEEQKIIPGKTFRKLYHDGIVVVLEKGSRISDGHAGFQRNGGCVDHVYTARGEIIPSRKGARLKTFFPPLDAQKAFDTVWRYGLWKQLSKYGI